MFKISEIESQINQIVSILPTITDPSKKTALMTSISPVLDRGLDELILALEKQSTDQHRRRNHREATVIHDDHRPV